jgi:hypothetical protein
VQAAVTALPQYQDKEDDIEDEADCRSNLIK